MLETKDLILDKAKPEDWEDMYRNVWRHRSSARYMRWSVTERAEEQTDDRDGSTYQYIKYKLNL